jgi:hypothetical protein
VRCEVGRLGQRCPCGRVAVAAALNPPHLQLAAGTQAAEAPAGVEGGGGGQGQKRRQKTCVLLVEVSQGCESRLCEQMHGKGCSTGIRKVCTLRNMTSNRHASAFILSIQPTEEHNSSPPTPHPPAEPRVLRQRAPAVPAHCPASTAAPSLAPAAEGQPSPPPTPNCCC